MKNYKIIKFSEISSTNTYLKENSASFSDKTVIISDIQTSGRGRLGKTFHSNQLGGLYLSILLKDYQAPQELTIRASIAVSRAIFKAFGLDVNIKWVNDIYYNGKKLCGILCERTGDGSIVSGIGINVENTDFPKEVSHIAAAIKQFNPSAKRDELLPILLSEFETALYEDFPILLKEYKKRCFILGQAVIVNIGDLSYDAVAKDILDDGNLLVQKQDGDLVSLNSGEIVLKIKNI